MSKSYSLKSPAKLNLGLRIVGRRSDGLHLIESLFWAVNLCDTVECQESIRDEVTMRLTEGDNLANVPLVSSSENIVSRALCEVRKKFSIPFFRVTIHKKIPMGGGLGGGSSNAATILKFIGNTFGVDVKSLELLALKLGADVPFFFDPNPNWVSGIGEVRTPLQTVWEELSPLTFVLVFPCFTSSTAETFGDYRRQKKGFSPSLLPNPLGEGISLNSLSHYLGSARNDLLPIVKSKHPFIEHILTALRANDSLFSSMSGSGSTLFGVYRSPDSAREAAKVLSPICRQNTCRLASVTTYRG